MDKIRSALEYLQCVESLVPPLYGLSHVPQPTHEGHAEHCVCDNDDDDAKMWEGVGGNQMTQLHVGDAHGSYIIYHTACIPSGEVKCSDDDGNEKMWEEIR